MSMIIDFGDVLRNAYSSQQKLIFKKSLIPEKSRNLNFTSNLFPVKFIKNTQKLRNSQSSC